MIVLREVELPGIGGKFSVAHPVVVRHGVYYRMFEVICLLLECVFDEGIVSGVLLVKVE